MPFPRLVTRVFSLLLFLAGLTIAVAVSLVAAYQLARFTPRIGMLVIAACLVCFLVTLLAATLAARLWPADVRKLPIACGAMVTGLFSVALFMTALRPMRYLHLVPVARADTQYWNLPTGSRIAYSVYPQSSGQADLPFPGRYLARSFRSVPV